MTDTGKNDHEFNEEDFLESLSDVEESARVRHYEYVTTRFNQILSMGLKESLLMRDNDVLDRNKSLVLSLNDLVDSLESPCREEEIVRIFSNHQLDYKFFFSLTAHDLEYITSNEKKVYAQQLFLRGMQAWYAQRFQMNEKILDTLNLTEDTMSNFVRTAVAPIATFVRFKDDDYPNDQFFQDLAASKPKITDNIVAILRAMHDHEFLWNKIISDALDSEEIEQMMFLITIVNRKTFQQYPDQFALQEVIAKAVGSLIMKTDTTTLPRAFGHLINKSHSLCWEYYLNYYDNVREAKELAIEWWLNSVPKEHQKNMPTRLKKMKKKFLSKRVEKRESSSSSAPKEFLSEEIIEAPSIENVTPQQLLQGGALSIYGVPENAQLCVKITRASNKGKFSVPQDKTGFDRVPLEKNNDGLYVFPNDFNWQQPGKIFGFEFFVEVGGMQKRSECSKRIEVSVEKQAPKVQVIQEEKPIVHEEETALSPIGEVEPQRPDTGNNNIDKVRTVYPWELQPTTSRVSQKVEQAINHNPEKDALEAWECVLDDKKALESFIKSNLEQIDGGSYFTLPFPADYAALMDGTGILLPEYIGMHYDVSTQKLVLNYDYVSHEIEKTLIEQIQQKFIRQKKEKREILRSRDEGRDQMKSKKVQDQKKERRDYAESIPKRGVRFICYFKEEGTSQVEYISGVENIYEAVDVLKHMYGSDIDADVVLQRSKINTYGPESIAKRESITRWKSDENFDIAFESPEKLLNMEQRIASHFGVIRSTKVNTRTGFSNGAQFILDAMLQERQLWDSRVPEEEIPDEYRKVERDDIDAVFVREFLDKIQENGYRISFTKRLQEPYQTYIQKLEDDIIPERE